MCRAPRHAAQWADWGQRRSHPGGTRPPTPHWKGPMEIWPEAPTPRCHVRRHRRQLRPVLRGRRARRAVPHRRRRQGRPVSPCRRSTASSGTATCRACSPASATASACTDRTTPPTGTGATSKLLLDPQGLRRDVRRRRVPLLVPLRGRRGGEAGEGGDDGAPAKLNTLDSLATRCCPWSSTRSSTGAGPPAAARVPRERHLRGARQGHDPAAPRDPGGDPRHGRDRAPRDDRAPQGPRRLRSS